MKKILFTVNTLGRAGAETALLELLRRLEGCGYEISLYVIMGQGEMVGRQYHHGRCDIGSPWACGTAFDVLE